jgi:hypothetical protein
MTLLRIIQIQRHGQNRVMFDDMSRVQIRYISMPPFNGTETTEQRKNRSLPTPPTSGMSTIHLFQTIDFPSPCWPAAEREHQAPGRGGIVMGEEGGVCDLGGAGARSIRPGVLELWITGLKSRVHADTVRGRWEMGIQAMDI